MVMAVDGDEVYRELAVDRAFKLHSQFKSLHLIKFEEEGSAYTFTA
jgi:hypothetical protein